MIIYSVTITLDAAFEAEWLDWMQRTHVPDVLRTGCFLDCGIYKVADAAAEAPAYVMQYHCRSREEYERYRNNFAPALQKDHTERFAGRFRGSRQLLERITRTQP